ncbi:MAG TPA: flagellar hook-basal body complex protein FliE [Xanthobacteraceae bacterium]|nr:flagellar hook-basal body complex protein FliE [Xanthobacteraceae bacterium]
MPSPLAAANAYAALAKVGAKSLSAPAAAGEKADGGFAATLRQAIDSVIESGRKSDAQARALASGKANVVDVVTAVAETEVAVETLVAVRDRVIQSYEEIMRMPI